MCLSVLQKHVPSWLRSTRIYRWPQDTVDLLLRLFREERYVPQRGSDPVLTIRPIWQPLQTLWRKAFIHHLIPLCTLMVLQFNKMYGGRLQHAVVSHNHKTHHKAWAVSPDHLLILVVFKSILILCFFFPVYTTWRFKLHCFNVHWSTSIKRICGLTDVKLYKQSGIMDKPRMFF